MRNYFISILIPSYTMAQYKGAASEASRAMHLMKKREKAQQEIEFRKKKLEEDLKISNIENKFAAHYDAVEQQLKVGGYSHIVPFILYFIPGYLNHNISDSNFIIFLFQS